MKFLLCYDYPMGGVWFWVEADAVDQVRKRFSGSKVFEKPPEWWSARPASTLGTFAVDQVLPPAVDALVRKVARDNTEGSAKQ